MKGRQSNLKSTKRTIEKRFKRFGSTFNAKTNELSTYRMKTSNLFSSFENKNENTLNRSKSGKRHLTQFSLKLTH